MNVNGFHEIDDASPETVALLADLIEASRTDEQMIYREAELDELWRWIGVGHTGEVTIPADRLDATLAEVMAIHDLTEEAGNAAEAARRLRALMPAPAHQP